MKKLAIVLITTLLSVNTWAQETDLSSTWLCITDDVNGFRWEHAKKFRPNSEKGKKQVSK